MHTQHICDTVRFLSRNWYYCAITRFVPEGKKEAKSFSISKCASIKNLRYIGYHIKIISGFSNLLIITVSIMLNTRSW